MSEIRAGDLVIIVRGTPCCKKPNSIGRIFSVRAIQLICSHCGFCGREYPEELLAVIAGTHYCQLNRLKKIHPLTEPTEQETEREAVV